MTKRPDLQWDPPSDPEISVSTIVQVQPERFREVDIVGERFGKYLLIGEIAVGGMAEIFLGVHKGLEGFIKVAVIKRVLPHFSYHAEFVRMFVDEARLAARLEHPNIVRTYEFGEVGGQYFTAMEYLPGEDLCKALNNLSISRQVMPIYVAVGIVSQLCTGLHFAHQLADTDGRPLNLVHRDINPANIVVTYGGEVKIIDFGVAKSNTSTRTVTGTIKGKVAYMPPEQVLGRPVDHRADVFSAGVVLWEMLTGRPLFLRDNEGATLYAIMNSVIPPPSKYRRDVSPQLDRVVARALARLPDDRFDTAEDLATALDDAAQQMPRYDARVLGKMVEGLFGSTRAEAKRGIAQTASLTRNISLVMKLRSEIRSDLAERLDAATVIEDGFDSGPHSRPESEDGGASGSPDLAIEAVEPAPSQRGMMIVLGAIMLASIGAGVAYTTSRTEQPQVSRPVVQTALQIDSTPPGAAVFVGGEPTGLKTPTTLTGLATAQVAIRLELPDHRAVVETVALAGGATTIKHFTLAALPGRLVISELPVSAEVFVDGTEYAAGELIAVAPGKHVVRIVIDGRTVTQQPIDTTSGDQGWKLVRDKLVRN
jgi:eukaryotic-like serine/threonine-protein kinase